ncbi:hypothetical protein B0H12DRAFT_1137238 [Mycena haematopus]|nr:hypothetical protein B0H12DRAFT_1137238 [Mycena haematopus]
MDEALEPPAPIFASRGGTSIKSTNFRERMTSSSPPSIGGDSTRTRRTFGMGLLDRRAKNQPPTEKLVDAERGEPSENEDPGLRNHDEDPGSKILSRPAPPAPTTANKQSSGLFRKLTTKFNRNRARSTSPPANKRRSLAIPQPSNSAWALQEARNAALRERGLLPPLPLSVQEAQQDSRIAVVAPPEPGQSELGRRQTAANRVKEEWEAKNRERLNEFRFGGNSPATSPVQQNFPATGLQEAETHFPTPLLSPDAQEPLSDFVDEPEAKAPRAPPPTLNLSREHRLSPPLLQAWSDAPPDPSFLPSPTSGTTTEAHFPSLISAFTSTPAADATFTPISPSFLPLPPSPSCSDPTFNSTLRDGTETPRVGGDCTPKPTSVSLDGSSLTPPSRSQSIPRMDASESESTLGVPSLIDSESQTSMSTSDSLGDFGRMRNVPLATKVRNSTFEPQGSPHHAISVIVESPTEDRDETVLSASPVDKGDSQPKALPMPSKEPMTPQRRTTDPMPPTAQVAAQVDRRKTLNVFKKMSIRRPMGLGRAKSSAKPPTPTLPASFAGQQQHRMGGRPVGAAQQHRTTVSPTMHNAGSILLEMNKIENDESRRMTEVAFM